ncbi:cis-Golgi t-SNARE syntaxin [Lunasporangiospora selenospora]|uniref:Cis-Golgi t-SNARE syntaxin n=1 Tax=Lunasporangiospora selenospora TaxID=979761 RepID=A0A9P6G3X3_9FUNG|nr:cis-Golgi t-SNARE syntaxin [Lunasporangiospora selenospora]
MDRTSEFFATIESLRSRAQHHLPSDKRRLLSPIEQQQQQPGNGTPHGQHQKSEFTLIASMIAKDIHATAAKLTKLARLAKRKTLFDDRPVEISDIAKINKQIAQLQTQVRDQNTSGGRQQAGLAPLSKQAIEHNSNVVVLLQSRLAAQTSTFKDVLEVRTENMKATKDRREQFMFSAQQQASAFSSDSPLYNLDRRATSSSSPPKDVLSLDLTTPSQLQQQQQMEQVQLQDSNNQYLESRSTAVESIESTLHELGGIFQQLAQMVSEQREMVQRIDNNTEDIESNVAGAQTELLKYYSYVSSNRWLMVKVFAVIISSAVTLSVLS